MSEIYKKFCNSMDAYSPEAAGISGIVGFIFIVMSMSIPLLSFIPERVSNNVSYGFVIIGSFLIFVLIFRLVIYPTFIRSIN